MAVCGAGSRLLSTTARRSCRARALEARLFGNKRAPRGIPEQMAWVVVRWSSCTKWIPARVLPVGLRAWSAPPAQKRGLVFQHIVLLQIQQRRVQVGLEVDALFLFDRGGDVAGQQQVGVCAPSGGRLARPQPIGSVGTAHLAGQA